MKRLKPLLYIFLVILAISLVFYSIQTSPPNHSSVQKREIPLQKVTFDPAKVVMGQTVYVPIYSHIYHDNNQNHVMNLSATLSVRNTDLKNSIIITSVQYYNTDGQLLRKDVEHPVGLKPLASTSFFIAADDTSGGAGANFIVEWVAEKKVSEPVIEAVMISTSLSQGISFVSPGKVLQQHGRRD